MKQIKIPDKLYDDLRAFTDKQNVPLQNYVRGWLRTSMRFPDGIEVSETFTSAKEELARKESFNEGTEHAINAIINCEGWMFDKMSEMLGSITIGTLHHTSFATDITVCSDILGSKIIKAMRDTKTASIARAVLICT